MYYTYMLRCEDQSIYTGITTDPDRRFSEHLSGSKKAAAYTRTHHAEKMIALWCCDSRSDACKLESAYFILFSNLNIPSILSCISSPDSLSSLGAL